MVDGRVGISFLLRGGEGGVCFGGGECLFGGGGVEVDLVAVAVIQLARNMTSCTENDVLLCLSRIVQFEDVYLERLSVLSHLAKRDGPRFVEFGVYPTH